MKSYAILSTFLALSACIVEPPPLPPTGGFIPQSTCGADALQGLVGQPARVLRTMRFAGPVRIIEPGMAVTMDFSAERLNIWLNENRVIDRVTCG